MVTATSPGRDTARVSPFGGPDRVTCERARYAPRAWRRRAISHSAAPRSSEIPPKIVGAELLPVNGSDVAATVVGVVAPADPVDAAVVDDDALSPSVTTVEVGTVVFTTEVGETTIVVEVDSAVVAGDASVVVVVASSVDVVVAGSDVVVVDSTVVVVVAASVVVVVGSAVVVVVASVVVVVGSAVVVVVAASVVVVVGSTVVVVVGAAVVVVVGLVVVVVDSWHCDVSTTVVVLVAEMWSRGQVAWTVSVTVPVFEPGIVVVALVEADGSTLERYPVTA